MEPSTASTPPLLGDVDERRARTIGLRVGISLLVVVFATFWTWALFFASKEAVNRIGDRAWADRAELICQDAKDSLVEMADFREIRDAGPELIVERAAIVDTATDILDRMVDDVAAVDPADRKGSQIVPLWEADYRVYLQDRRNFADQLRASGENLAFYETAADGIPVSERIETFAGDNDMPACAPPRDLTR